jgi:hypothetical protein
VCSPFHLTNRHTCHHHTSVARLSHAEVRQHQGASCHLGVAEVHQEDRGGTPVGPGGAPRLAEGHTPARTPTRSQWETRSVPAVVPAAVTAAGSARSDGASAERGARHQVAVAQGQRR